MWSSDKTLLVKRVAPRSQMRQFPIDAPVGLGYVWPHSDLSLQEHHPWDEQPPYGPGRRALVARRKLARQGRMRPVFRKSPAGSPLGNLNDARVSRSQRCADYDDRQPPIRLQELWREESGGHVVRLESMRIIRKPDKTPKPRDDDSNPITKKELTPNCVRRTIWKVDPKRAYLETI